MKQAPTFEKIITKPSNPLYRERFDEINWKRPAIPKARENELKPRKVRVQDSGGTPSAA